MKSRKHDSSSMGDFLLEHLNTGQRIVLGHAAGEPVELVSLLLNRFEHLRNIEILHMVPLGLCSYCLPEYEGHFRHNAVFAGQPTRQAIAAGRADFTPAFFSELPRLFRSGQLPVDVAMISVSPPDENGDVSLGVSSDYTLQAAKSARCVVAEINHWMPRTFGSTLNLSEIDALIETERPLPELQPSVAGKVEMQIGSHIRSLIADGDCLQLGIGSIPDAVLSQLCDRNDLGVHTEMFSDGLVQLLEAGNITNAHKPIDTGLTVATFLMGSQKLYRYVHLNPKILMKPVDYTNDVAIGGQIPNLKSINSAIEVDLHGQVCADMIGPKQFSAVGGQVDFVRIAARSAGGRSVIALPSTAKNGTVSRIVPRLSAGACVTTSRYDVDTIVTEFGIAELKGRSIAARQRALIDIAHPNFRDMLRDSIQQHNRYD